MKVIKFREYLVIPILTQEKTSTWRLFDDKNLQVGDNIELQIFGSEQKFAEAIITEIKEKPFKDLTDKDKQGHESFPSDEEMYATYSHYYKRQVTSETPVKVIRFNLIKQAQE